MSEKRKKYDREFREGAVRIVRETGKSIAQVARDLGIDEGTCLSGCPGPRGPGRVGANSTRDDLGELKRLRSEVAELRMERDVLEAISGPVGEGGDEVSVARFIADQRAKHRVPHTITCVLLGVSVSWFYKWITRADTTDGLHTDTDRRRAQLDTAVAAAFKVAKGLHGSPRLIADLRDLGWEVSEKTVADSMRRQGLVARRIKRRNG